MDTCASGEVGFGKLGQERCDGIERLNRRKTESLLDISAGECHRRSIAS